MRKIPFLMMCCLLAATGPAFGADPAWEPPPWGLNLEQLNQLFKQHYKDGLIFEDKGRVEIELQYSPSKSMRIPKGDVVALVSKEDPSKASRLYGYAFEGKVFGKVNLFRDRPEVFPQTVIRALQKAYPQSKISPSIGKAETVPSFEYKSDQLYIFTNERGVYYYHFLTLEKLAKGYEKKMDDINLKMRDEWGSKAGMP
jgi:hypothetical protein